MPEERVRLNYSRTKKNETGGVPHSAATEEAPIIQTMLWHK
jgi:hypothetical protein